MTTRESERPGGALAGLWPPPQDGWIAASAVAVLYAAHLAYAAIVSDTALLMGLAAAALLAAALLQPRLRADLLRLRGLEVSGVLFVLVLAVGAWSLTPYVPGGPHPVWTYVGQAGAATVDRSSTLVELVKLLGLACFFLIGAAAGARDERARFAVQLTVLAGAAFGLWAIVVSATGAIVQTQGHRLEAHFLNPNTAGTVFGALFVLAVAALIREVRVRARSGRAYLFSLAAFVLGVALLNTASRGAVTAALLGVLVLLAVQLSTGALKWTRAVAGVLAAVAALAVLVVIAGDAVVERFFRAEADASVRYEIWAHHWRAFQASPWLGYGLGAFEPVNKSLLSEASFEALHNLRAPLNVYLQWLEEAGLLGAAPMFLCVAWLLMLTIRGTLRRSRMTGLLAGLIALDVVFLVHGFTDSSLQAPSVAAFWAWALGLQAALAQGSSRR